MIPLLGSNRYNDERFGKIRAKIHIESYDGGRMDFKSSSKDAVITLGVLQTAIAIVQSSIMASKPANSEDAKPETVPTVSKDEK